MGGWYDGFVSWAQTVDWQAWAIILGAVINAAVLFWAARSAVQRIDQHRESHLAKRQVEAAEDILTYVAEAKHYLSVVRYPDVTMEELYEVEKLPERQNETDEGLRQKRNYIYIFLFRMEKHQSVWRKFESMHIKSSIFFDEETANLIARTDSTIKKVRSALMSIYQDQLLIHNVKTDDPSYNKIQKHTEDRIKRNESIAWGASNEDDPIHTELNYIHGEIRERLLRIVTAK